LAQIFNHVRGHCLKGFQRHGIKVKVSDGRGDLVNSIAPSLFYSFL